MLSLKALKIEEDKYGHAHGVSEPNGRVGDASLPEIGDEVVVGVADDAAPDEVADFGGG